MEIHSCALSLTYLNRNAVLLFSCLTTKVISSLFLLILLPYPNCSFFLIWLFQVWFHLVTFQLHGAPWTDTFLSCFLVLMLLWTVCLCPLKFIHWSPNPERGSIWRWGLWEVQTYSVFLCFTVSQTLRFYKLKVCGNPESSKSISAIFPTTFAHFMSLYHIMVIVTVFQTFSWLLFLIWWSAVSDLWCYYYDSLKSQMRVSDF